MNTQSNQMSFRELLDRIAKCISTETNYSMFASDLYADLNNRQESTRLGIWPLPKLNDSFELQPYLLYTDCPHVPESFLLAFETRKELEGNIVGGIGLLNGFTGNVVALKRDQILPFHVEFMNPAGQYVRFHKDRQKAFKNSYPCPRVVWSQHSV
jgi:hypothetical protein